MKKLIDAVARWGVKKWVLGIVNDALARYKDNVAAARSFVAARINRVETLLSWLKNLDRMLADNVISESEADEIAADAARLAERIAAK